MISVALYQPEIPPNAGNIIRLCANTGARLHLIEPLGFEIDDKRLRRAGLDYHEWASMEVHANIEDLLASHEFGRVFGISTRGRTCYTDIRYREDDLLLFGPETRGLPQSLIDALPENHRIRIPMQPHSRSINLSNSVAIVVYEVWRQQSFSGGT